jgi:hypothetical protein
MGELAIKMNKSDGQNEVKNPNSYCYTPIDEVVIEYIRNLGITRILEMCSGDGSNAKTLRRYHFQVEAFDLKTDKESGIKYGVSGTVEQAYSDHLLFLASGICSQKSVDNYKGKYVLLGGHGENAIVNDEEIEIVEDMTKPEIKLFKNISFSYSSSVENRSIKIDIRPSYKFMIGNNFKLDKMWFITNKNALKWTEIFVFQLWIRAI